MLPTKSVQQCYLQTQRLMGQQSLAEFMGLSVDIDTIARENKNRKVRLFLAHAVDRVSESAVSW